MPGPEQYQLDHQFRMALVRLVQKAILYATWIVLVYWMCHFGYLSVRELSGRQTNADILLRAYAFLKVPKALALVLANAWGIGATGWALAERRSKKNNIARTHVLIRDAQRLRDPGKGSSNITLQGDTAPEDI